MEAQQLFGSAFPCSNQKKIQISTKLIYQMLIIIKAQQQSLVIIAIIYYAIITFGSIKHNQMGQTCCARLHKRMIENLWKIGKAHNGSYKLVTKF